MIIRRDLVIAVLLTFCFSATLFSVISTKSQYDPWTDLNDDGAIDSTDLGMLGTGWGEFGDPAKNVNITSYTAISDTINVTLGPGVVFIETNGFRQISLGLNNFLTSNITCYVAWFVGKPQTQPIPFGSDYSWDSFTVTAYDSSLKVYNVIGSEIILYITGSPSGSVWLDYYLTP